MICASSSSSRCCGIALTEATVPTGMKTGVSTAACGSVIVARRAFPLVFRILKSRDTLSIVTSQKPVAAQKQRARREGPRPFRCRAVGSFSLEVQIQTELHGAGRSQTEDARSDAD